MALTARGHFGYGLHWGQTTGLPDMAASAARNIQSLSLSRSGVAGGALTERRRHCRMSSPGPGQLACACFKRKTHMIRRPGLLMRIHEQGRSLSLR